MDNVIEVLKRRGFIDNMTADIQADRPLKFYCGFDPTADSLHLGNMVALMGMAWLQKFGHKPYVIVGGATGAIGDPSGRSLERPVMAEETLKQNLSGISKNISRFVKIGEGATDAVLLNNDSWFSQMSFTSFLREVGRYFRLGQMLGKESVRARLNSEEGISFTEFSYQLLQAYDFLYLFDHFGVQLELGGSDQWGNITAGIELVRKVRNQEVYGFTFPLLVKSDGQKFGKSHEGAIWLSPEKLSPYKFYQYLIRVSDADVIKLLKMLTFLPIEEIEALEQAMSRSEYLPNTAQKKLAEEVTRIVHGEEALLQAIEATKAAAPGKKGVLEAAALLATADSMPNFSFPLQEIEGKKLIDLIVEVKLSLSKGEVKKMMRNGGVYLNNQPISDEGKILSLEDVVDGQLLLLALGKKNKALIKLTP
ncbi:MAG: tyrS [Chlamydiales bacterium]|jgi:tyrosyl-tRNA synthetase|nr:tyrS [Chlamydiales bacterium]